MSQLATPVRSWLLATITQYWLIVSGCSPPIASLWHLQIRSIRSFWFGMSDTRNPPCSNGRIATGAAICFKVSWKEREKLAFQTLRLHWFRSFHGFCAQQRLVALTCLATWLRSKSFYTSSCKGLSFVEDSSVRLIPMWIFLSAHKNFLRTF